MSNQPTIDTATIYELELRDAESARQLSFHQRGVLIEAACRAAAEIEKSRVKAGMPPSQPVPWPESTWRFLAEASRRVQEGTYHE